MTQPVLLGLLLIIVGACLATVPPLVRWRQRARRPSASPSQRPSAALTAETPRPSLIERRRVRWPALGVAALFVVVGLGVTAWGVALGAGDRTPVERSLATGVTYRRIVIAEPRPQVVHLGLVDLDDPCIRLETTPLGPDGVVEAERTSDYVDRTGAVLAVNVAFFFPIDEYPHWSAYPRPGDPITAIGPVVVDGRTFESADQGWGYGVGLTDGLAWAGALPAAMDFAVPARIPLVHDGVDVAPESAAYPRTVAGVDLDRNRLVLLVADGKQPGYAEGMTFREAAALLLSLGVDEAVEFDGGGSSTMAATVDGGVELLSRPSHQRIPGRQRPLATHLGVVLAEGCS
ncbi:MAG: phosphodiester glycosidase family protein [Actinomycetota bacterium]